VVIERATDEKTGKIRKEIRVDEIRTLQNFYNKTSSAGGWRIVLIDSADEMNRNAANALLKILEEPPANSLLILLAHAPGRLLPTIKSRCRQMRLSSLPVNEVHQILHARFPDLGEAELSGYAILGDGSPGYAISLAEQEGLAIYASILGMMATLPNLDIPALHALAAQVSGKGKEKSFRLFGDLLGLFINRMVRHVSNPQSDIQEVMTNELDLMLRLGQTIPLDQWVEVWEKVNQQMARTDAINLDKKQVILNMFQMIADTVKMRG